MNTSAEEMVLFVPSSVQTGEADALCREIDSPVPTRKSEMCTVSRMDYVDGRAGESLNHLPGRDSGVLMLLGITILVVIYGMWHSSKLFGSLLQDLLSTRRRENAFDDHAARDIHVIIALILQGCVYQGLLLYAHINTFIPCAGSSPFVPAIAVIGITTALYLFQLAAVAVVGNVFSDKIGAVQWIKGFNAQHVLSGFLFAILAMVSLFYPETVTAMSAMGALLYIVARVIFICKGFRIFYYNFGSLLYFILYLCTLEIIPAVLAYSGACFLVGILQ